MNVASAATIDFDFSATLTSGPLAGTTFSGTGSYDPGADPDSTPRVPLTSLDFTLDGIAFPNTSFFFRNSQVDLIDGTLFSFEGSFTAIAAGTIDQLTFGVSLPPGVITYLAGPNADFGGGTYEVSVASTPEPPSLLFCGSTTFLTLLLVCFRRAGAMNADDGIFESLRGSGKPKARIVDDVFARLDESFVP